MAYQLRYFLVSCIMASSFFTASIQSATLQSIDQSVRDFGKHVKRYYKCVTSKCSEDEKLELKKHIYRDAAVIVAGIAGIAALGYGSYYLLKPKQQEQKTEPTPMEQLAGAKAAGREQIRQQVGQLQRTYYDKKIRFNYDGARLVVELNIPVEKLDEVFFRNLLNDLRSSTSMTIILKYYFDADQIQAMEMPLPEKRSARLKLVDNQWQTTDENIMPILQKAAAYRERKVRPEQDLKIRN